MLTETQKQKIRLYLGYPSAWRFKHTRLESVMDSASPEAEVQILEQLSRLEEIEEVILTTAVTAAGIRRVDEIEFFANGVNRTELQSLGRQYVGRLSIILGVPIDSDCFGRSGYLGDSFSSGGSGRGGGGGGPIRLG